MFSGDVSEPEVLKPRVLLGDDWMVPMAPTYVQSFTSKKEALGNSGQFLGDPQRYCTYIYEPKEWEASIEIPNTMFTFDEARHVAVPTFTCPLS